MDYLTDHRIGVDLTHVLATIFLLDVLYMQIPRRIIGMGYWHPGVVRDHVVVYSLDGFGVSLHPAHLKTKAIYYMIILKYKGEIKVVLNVRTIKRFFKLNVCVIFKNYSMQCRRILKKHSDLAGWVCHIFGVFCAM